MTITIPKPDYMTLEWVKLQKESGKTDQEIADSLYVSKWKYYKWLKELGHKRGDGWKYLRGGQWKVNPERVKYLLSKGMTQRDIAYELGTNKTSINRMAIMIKKGLL